MGNNNAVIIKADDYDLYRCGADKPGLGMMFEKILVDDPDTRMSVAHICYPKGFYVPLHTHTCGHGYYILKGTLYTSEGNYGPGSFVWFKKGVKMEHGARDEDVEAIAFANGPLDLTLL